MTARRWRLPMRLGPNWARREAASDEVRPGEGGVVTVRGEDSLLHPSPGASRHPLPSGEGSAPQFPQIPWFLRRPPNLCFPFRCLDLPQEDFVAEQIGGQGGSTPLLEQEGWPK